MKYTSNLILYFSCFLGSTSPNANNEIVRKPTRLEAMPNIDVRKNSRKRSNGPLLNTMGTF